jgi:hypothetical protein
MQGFPTGGPRITAGPRIQTSILIYCIYKTAGKNILHTFRLLFETKQFLLNIITIVCSSCLILRCFTGVTSPVMKEGKGPQFWCLAVSP